MDVGKIIHDKEILTYLTMLFRFEGKKSYQLIRKEAPEGFIDTSPRGVS